MPPSALSLKWASLAALVALQVAVGVVYKLSQSSAATYSYSTFSALAIAEMFKLAISAGMHTRAHARAPTDALPTSKQRAASATRRHAPGDVAKILALSLTYCVINQLSFAIFLVADPATINIFKSGSTLVTAAISCVVLARCVSWPQWAAIVLQVSGLLVTQYDPCADRLVLPASTYALLLVYVSLSALAAVWNEQQLKSMPMSLHEQNMVLYTGGVVFNAVGHCLKSALVAGMPAFFEGYGLASVAVVAVNACFGVAVTAVYKYADSIMKCLASAVTTVTLLAVSWAAFGLHLHATILAGCVTVVVSVALYSTMPADKGAVASLRQRTCVAGGLAALACACVVVGGSV